MARSHNPALSVERFEAATGDGVMTIGGTVFRALVLVLLVIGSSAYTWWSIATGVVTNPMPLLLVGVFGGLVLALLTAFVPRLAPWTSPLYAVTEGLALGTISLLFERVYPGLPLQAVLLTFGVFLAMLALYAFRVIRVTARFRAVILAAMLGILVFYLIGWVLRLFGMQIPLVHEGGMVGIGFSLFVCGIAAFSLLLDFDIIEQGANARAPRYMSWYGAFGLVVGLVWLYIELLNLLRKLRD